jgi:hypothetical protein
MKTRKVIDRKKGFSSIGDVLKDFQSDQDKYISHEFQKYGYELAKELGDLKRISLYIKLAKETPRGFLENAKNFVKDATNVKSKPRLFMWKLSELKKQAKLTHKRSTGKAENSYVATNTIKKGKTT